MNAERLLSAEATVSLAGVVAGELIPAQDRTLPSPRRIVAVFLFYGFLSLIAALGTGPARFASALGGLVALVALVDGAAGRALFGPGGLFGRASGLLGGTVQPGVGLAPAPPARYAPTTSTGGTV